MEAPLPKKFKMEWWFKSDIGKDVCIFLRVDEDSSSDELEAEIEYWMTQLRVYGIEGAEKKGIMGAVRWMMSLLDS
jgi:hypothetical protein